VERSRFNSQKVRKPQPGGHWQGRQGEGKIPYSKTHRNWKVIGGSREGQERQIKRTQVSYGFRKKRKLAAFLVEKVKEF